MTHDDPFGTPRRASGRDNDRLSLAGDVISILSNRRPTGSAGGRAVAVDYLVRAISVSDHFDPTLCLEELGTFRLTRDALIDHYIPDAARCLGELWRTSDLDFATVTIGSLRLQNLLNEITHGLINACGDKRNVLSALVVVPEAEQHFLGASVVSAQLRRLGCDVCLSINEGSEQILHRVTYDRPHIVLFSCARPAALETIQRNVKKIRQLGDVNPVLALGGAWIDDTANKGDETGVDLVTNTAKDVVSFATKHQKALGRQ